MKTANTALAFHSLMAVIFATFFWGCKDEHPQLFIDQKTKDYVVFQQGSWWSYEEKKSQSFDTVTVELFIKKMTFITDLSQFDFESIKIEFFWASFGSNNYSQSTGLFINADYDYNQNIGLCEEQYPWFLFPNIVFIPFDTVGEHRAIWENDTLRFTVL